MSKLVSKPQDESVVTESRWQSLKQFTSARIALGRTGTSIPTGELLDFQLDHARAIDAVHRALDVATLNQQLVASHSLSHVITTPPLLVQSKASDRMVYLQRPDLGRQLSEACWQQLCDARAEYHHQEQRQEQHKGQHQGQQEYDLAIVVADGLSSTAIQKHALPVIERLVEKLSGDDAHTWSLAPITIVTQGRVAVGDDVGECLNAKITLIMIGERPGLTSPDSMGIYLTWAPKRGAKDSSRNCISNIRPEGLPYEEAAHKAHYLLSESMKLQLTGIGLKDRSVGLEEEAQLESDATSSFLIG
ncbi:MULTISPECIES: ethanolamine ammonia-lyase subunit EutC [Aliagarivorans]|uniref:ethanolamine ammonia-lyase subunit EutC n=1 Tax=Aliagarivorans TaxID=882379 RepID=UPI0003F84790|nr:MULTISPECIES: ethanolamine ammonia-lyase subunit EutC [Aliagarivorans]